jgi:thiol peroxidase
MATTKFKGNDVSTCGDLPEIGNQSPDFTLVNSDLARVSLENFSGKRIIMNIFPSIDTPVCAMSVRRFNQEAAKLNNCAVLCISKDLPFAQKRFCGSEGIENVVTLSAMVGDDFGKNYGVLLTDGPLSGLLARAIIIIDETGKIVYSELASEITAEPDYEKALSKIK